MFGPRAPRTLDSDPITVADGELKSAVVKLFRDNVVVGEEDPLDWGIKDVRNYGHSITVAAEAKAKLTRTPKDQNISRELNLLFESLKGAFLRDEKDLLLSRFQDYFGSTHILLLILHTKVSARCF